MHPDQRRDAVTCATALAVVGVGAVVADRHPSSDRWLFALVNDHREEPRVLRVLQQAGTPWMLPVTAGLSLLLGRRRLALAAALGVPVEKALEVGIKKARPVPRPLHVEPTVLRDDAPVEGESYPSGHAAIAATAASLVAPHLPPAARPALFAAAAGAGVVRVWQGAHHPVDVLGGTALGIAIGAALRLVVGR